MFHRLMIVIVGALGLLAGAVARGAEWSPAATTRMAPPEAIGNPIPLPFEAWEYTIVPQTGVIAAVRPEASVVLIYPDLASKMGMAPQGKETVVGAVAYKEVKVGSTPVSIIHKKYKDKGYLLVLCRNGRTMSVLDDQTFATVKEVKLDGPRPMSLAAPWDAGVPYAYYLSGDFNQRTLWRVNLESWTDEGEIKPDVRDGWTAWNLKDIGFSADGRFLFGMIGDRSVGFFEMLVSPEGRAQSRFCWGAEGVPPYAMDPFGQFLTADKQVFDVLKKPRAVNGAAKENLVAGALPVTPTCFIPNRAVAFGLLGRDLWAFSTNTYQALQHTELPAWPLPARASTQMPMRLDLPERRTPALLYNEKGDTLVYCQRGHALVIQVKALQLPQEPRIHVTVEGPSNLLVGTKATWKLALADPAVKLELRNSPRGMALEKDSLQWTPAASDVGHHAVQLVMKAGSTERVRLVDIAVRQPCLELPFPADDLVLSPDGLTMAGVKFSTDTGLGQHGGARIALVDTRSMSITVDRVLPLAGRGVGLDNKQVYFSPLNTDSLYVYSRKDLLEVRKIFADSNINRFVPVAERFLMVFRDSRDLPQILSTNDLTPVPSMNSSDSGIMERLTPRKTGDGWYCQGVLWDATLTKARWLILPHSPVRLPRQFAPNVDVASYQPFILDPEKTLHPWGVLLFDKNRLVRSSRQLVGDLACQDAIVLPQVPLVAALAVDGVLVNPAEGYSSSPRRIRMTLTLRDLISAAPWGEPFVVSDEIVAPSDLRDLRKLKLFATPEAVYIHLYNQIWKVPLDLAKAATAVQPLHYHAEQSTFTIDLSRPTVLKFKTSGGKAPLKYSLLTAQTGMTINPATGDITADGPALTEALVKLVLELIPIKPGGAGATDPWYQDEFKKLHDKCAESYAAITGKPLEGVSVTIPYSLLAEDAEGQKALVHGACLADLSWAQVEKAHRARLEKFLTPPRPATVPTPQPAPPVERIAPEEIRRLEAQLKTLQQRNAELEGQVRLLKEILQGSGPATRP